MNNFIQAIFEEIKYHSPQELFEAFADTQHNLLIDSADGLQKGYGTSRYSYILVDPFDVYIFHANRHAQDQSDPFADLRLLSKKYKQQPVKELPPFQGGFAGYFSYDLAHINYPVLKPKKNDLDFPEIYMGLYDLVCSFDHNRKKSFIVATGFPEIDKEKRQTKAIQRIAWFKQQINSYQQNNFFQPTIHSENIQSNFTQTQYLSAVEKTIEYIRAGDIFEANISQRFETILPKEYPHYLLFKNLCRINPSPFAAYLNLGKFKILSASPERFIKLQDGEVETRPIKGTRKRSADPLQDAMNIQDLMTSEKDIAENIMIVDLMRNDLSMVCEDDSVTVPQLCGHEVYPTVHHLVSVVLGKLKPDEDVYSLLKKTFPGGSITGAPKIRAMQIIAEIEPHPRGPYCGSIALIGFDGNMDSSILIRTYVIKENLLTFHAGGAVVIDSCPLEEYQETLHKSTALKKALTEIDHDITH
jgi:para-aminobenzoate synthetase component 1